MFALRLLIALCAVPLVAVAFTGVGYLTVRVHSLYLLLSLACVALALMVVWHVDRLYEDEGSAIWVIGTGAVLVVAVFTGYVLTIGWIAPRHTCTVVEAGTWSRVTPGGGQENHEYRQFVCDDGRTDMLGMKPAPQMDDITDITDRYKGSRTQVAYDPNGPLPSMTVRHRIPYLLFAAIGMAFLVVFHIVAVLDDQDRRRSGNSLPAGK
ncbi:hypothetical protein GCM10022254_61580 [Actinomadura meridiana]|uniref:DUF3592 domain-containing protein n=1 Tax=Actinomadura meridiana TaxID=559626 RepID=A0ABP8CJA1_9ACTN